METHKVKHTPLPWRVETKAITHPDIGDVAVVYMINNADESVYEQEANAKFIVRACNSHYELLEACKEAYELVKNECEAHDKGDISRGDFTLLEELEDVIAKAEGKV